MKRLHDQLMKMMESVVFGIMVSLNLGFQIKHHLLGDHKKKPFGFFESLHRRCTCSTARKTKKGRKNFEERTSGAGRG